MRRTVALAGGAAVAVLGALLVSACGGGGAGGSGGSGGGGGSDAASTVTVTVTDSGFSPATINLSKTGTYTFHEVNKGTKQHSIDIEGNGVNEDGKDIGPGQSQDLQVEMSQPGTYQLFSTDDGDSDRPHDKPATISVSG